MPVTWHIKGIQADKYEVDCVMSTASIKPNRGTNTERIWLLAIILAAIVLYIPTFRFLWGKWMQESQYSLAFLVPPISAYFTWKNWPEIKKLERSPSIWGLVILIIAILLHLAGTLLDVSGPSGVSIILALIGGCMYFHSTALVRILWFPLAFTVFMIPVPGGLIDKVGLPLQLWSSASTAAILRVLGLDVVREGITLTVDGARYDVAQACSGMSSLVALMGVTAVFAYITTLPNIFRWVLFALSIPVALAANVVRIVTITLVGQQWGQDVAIHIYHDWSSPMLFLAAICFLLLINWGFECLSARLTTSSS